jgi:hypothetical protein
LTASIAFALHPREDFGGLFEVVPVVDGIELTDRIDEFELEQRMEPAGPGAYMGLSPAQCAPTEAHYLGQNPSFVTKGRAPLLGCGGCGEWACWPLWVRIVVGETTITWTEFEQPYREGRDHSRFGPFVFDRREYESALSELASGLAAARLGPT